MQLPRWPFSINRNSPQALGLRYWWPMIGAGLDLSTDDALYHDMAESGYRTDASFDFLSGASDSPSAAFLVPTFNGTTSFGAFNIDLSDVSKVIITCWAYFDSYDASDSVLFELTNDYNLATTGFFTTADGAAGTFGIGCKGDVGYNDATFTQPAAATWNHLVLGFDKAAAGSAEVYAFMNGVGPPAGWSYGNTSNNTNNFGASTLNWMNRGGSGGALLGPGRLFDVRIYAGVTWAGDATMPIKLYDPATRYELFHQLPRTTRKFIAAAAPGGGNRRRRVIMSRAG